ncbi:Uncharacterised protein [Pseudomonas aeruginosa]|nr:Uncharacterised protein [Pseudomonas aeruginosa]
MRAEAGRPGRQPALRARPTGARRHPRRWQHRRGHHQQRTHHSQRTSEAAWRRLAGDPRSARRGVHVQGRFRGAQRQGRGNRRQDLRQPAQRGGRQPAPAGFEDHRQSPAGVLCLRLRPSQRDAAGHPGGHPRGVPRLGYPHQSRAAPGQGRPGLPRLLRRHRSPTRCAGLRDRRRGVQGQPHRLPARTGLPRARAALGDRPQVPRARGADRAAGCRVPGRPHRRRDPGGTPQAGAGGRRHGVQCDPAQHG